MSFVATKDVIIRKEQKCFGCDRLFPKGTKLQRITQTDAGEIYSLYFCKTCQTYWDRYMDSDSQINNGELCTDDKELWEKTRQEVEGTTDDKRSNQ